MDSAEEVCLSVFQTPFMVAFKQSIETHNLKETYSLIDIWKIRNPKAKQYTFWEKYASEFLHRRLDYFFIFNNIQEFILDTGIILATPSDYSPISISISKEKQNNKSSGFWKFNISLCLIFKVKTTDSKSKK